MRALRLSLLVVALISGVAAPSAMAQPWPAPAGHRELADFAYDSSLTEAQVRARWGESLQTVSTWLRYELDSGELLELLFDTRAPNGLMQATLSQRDGSSRDLYKNFPRARSRRLDQIDYCNTWPGTIEPVWGYPDYRWGSGIDHRVYEMADGDTVWLFPTGMRPSVVVWRDGKSRELPDPPCRFKGGLPPPPPVPAPPE